MLPQYSPANLDLGAPEVNLCLSNDRTVTNYNIPMRSRSCSWRIKFNLEWYLWWKFLGADQRLSASLQMRTNAIETQIPMLVEIWILL